MNDLDVLRAFGADLDTVDAPETAGAPPRLRHRIVTGIADGDTSPFVVRRQRRSSLASLAALATTAAVIALAIGLAVTVQRTGVRRAADPPAPDAGMDAPDVLLAAAAAARDERTTAPPADGWIYTRTITLHIDWAAQGRYQWGTESWWSVAGHDGVWAFDSRGRKPYMACETAQRAECPIPPGYLTDLPDDPAAVLDVLDASDVNLSLAGEEVGAPIELGEAWVLLLRSRVVAPEARAALYEALATLPELTVTPGVTAADGSVGTAISQRAEVTDDETGRTMTMRGELIFDPETYALIGWRWVYDTGDAELGIPAGAVEYTVANLAQEAVPERWARPDGTVARDRSAREEHAWEISSAQPGPLWKVPTLGTGPDADQAPEGPPVEQASAIPGGG